MMTYRLQLIAQTLDLLPADLLAICFVECILDDLLKIKFPDGAVTAFLQILAAMDVELSLVDAGRMVAAPLWQLARHF